jgi:hypothetical protein
VSLLPFSIPHFLFSVLPLYICICLSFLLLMMKTKKKLGGSLPTLSKNYENLKRYIYLNLQTISNKKSISYKVLDHAGLYTFGIKFVFIRLYLKIMNLFVCQLISRIVDFPKR